MPLACSHNLLAVWFVCILRWDNDEDWLPLFGRATESYSLRRFSGAL